MFVGNTSRVDNSTHSWVRDNPTLNPFLSGFGWGGGALENVNSVLEGSTGIRSHGT